MKKRIFVCLLALMLLPVLFVTGFAASGDSQAQLSYVTDVAGLLTEEQRLDLESRAGNVSARYGFSIYILAVEDYRNYSPYSDIFDCMVSIYEKYDLGWGSNREGTSLMLSMNDRDYCLHFNSDRADTVFTEAGRDWMEERILPYFGRNDYYGGFSEYLICCEEYLEAARKGTPVGEGVSGENTESGGLGIFSAIPGAIAALFTGMIAKAPMRSAVEKRDADSYVQSGSLRIHHRADIFLHRTVTRRPRQTESSRSSGGSSHHSSGSHSGRSGKF